MARTLLQRWLDHYDPIHRGWTPTGIAHGVCATCGWFFPLIAGGYHLRRGVGETPGASALIVGAAGADAMVIRTFPWVTHDAGTIYVYRLTAISGGGAENVADEVLAVTAFDASGDWVGARPNAPADVRVTPTAGGKFVLQWTYSREGEQAEPAGFRVYHDGGTGSVDFETVVGTVAYRRGRFHYRWLSESFTDGARVRWAVRAVSGEGAEEANEQVVSGWADAAAPPINPTVVLTCE